MTKKERLNAIRQIAISAILMEDAEKIHRKFSDEMTTKQMNRAIDIQRHANKLEAHFNEIGFKNDENRRSKDA